MKEKVIRMLLLLSAVTAVSACGKQSEEPEKENAKAGVESEKAGEEELSEDAQEESDDAPLKTVEDGASDAETSLLGSSLTALPDFEKQIDFLLEKRSEWQIEEEEWDNPGYAVTDLDGNGRLEIIYQQVQGSGLFTDMAVYEISEDKKSLISCYAPAGEGPDAADIGDESVKVMLEKDGTRHYLFQDGIRNGAAEFYEITYDVTMSDGKWEQKPLGYYNAIYENYYSDDSDDMELTETYEDADEKPISAEAYEKLGQTAYPDATEDVAAFGWFNKYAYGDRLTANVVQWSAGEDGGDEKDMEEETLVCNLTEEELRTQLVWSAGFFNVNALSTWNSLLGIELQRDYQNGWDEEEGRFLYSGYYDMIHLAGSCRAAHPDLENALSRLNSDNYDALYKYWEDLEADARGFAENGYEPDLELYANEEIMVRRSDAQVLSFVNSLEIYKGGAHGDGSYTGYNFDVKTGRQLEITDVVKDRNRLGDILFEMLSERYGDALYEEAETVLKDQLEFNWTLDPDGINFYFAPYDLAPYAFGMMQTKILFSQEPELFTEDYGPSKGSYVMEFGMVQPLLCDIDGDGNFDELTAFSDEDEYGSYQNLLLRLGDESYEDDNYYGYGFTPMLVHMDDTHNYLYLQCMFENDYESVLQFDLAGGKIKSLGDPVPGDLRGHLESYVNEWYGSWRMVMNDPDQIAQIARIDALSTYSGYRPCHINEKGEVVSDDDYWALTQFILTLKQDIAVDELEAETRQVNEKNVTIPKGETLQLMYTDNESYVDAQLSDGRMVRIYLESEEWPQTVGGIDIQDVFDGMMFAG